MHLRCICDIKRLNPQLLTSSILSICFNSAFPYVTIYCSARIINELAGLRRIHVLWNWVLFSIIVEAILFFVKEGTKKWHKACFDIFRIQRKKLYSDKMLCIDFSSVEKTETRDILDQIKQNDFNFEWGMGKTISIFDAFLSSLFGILCATILTVSLFMVPVPHTAGMLTFLNHPVITVLLVLLMMITTIIGSLCANKSTSILASLAEDNRFGNRLREFFGWISCDQYRAFDFRMYSQSNVIEYYHQKSLDIFGTEGEFAKNQKGKIGAMYALSGGLSAVITGLVYIYACLKAWAGAFGIGSVTQYISAISSMSQNIQQLMESIGEMITNTSFLRTTYTYLDMQNSIQIKEQPTQNIAAMHVEIEFENVSFRYPNSDFWALRNISMKIPKGSHVAIVGENGSGKTTYIKLLCRLYDPQEGRILLNGVDIHNYNYQDYMAILSVVFQDFQLLSQPLGDNVAGSTCYDPEYVLTCLHKAGLSEYLSKLPKGLGTQIYKDFGEDGIDISSGEAQKIALARALYKNTPFIILDEPTAALDPIAEAEIYTKFDEVVGNRTAIYISHRLSSCRFCDNIAVFDQGKIVQIGTHEDLLADPNGKYYELWNAQAQYYTEFA